MAGLKIRSGDRVMVIRGNHKGQEGTVRKVEPEKNRVIIEGVNLRKRHMKPSQTNPEGGIVEFEAPVHASNVMLIDPQSGEPTRVRRQVNENGKRERVAVKSGKVIPKH
jgi:large subunit ribosomal protein L24